VAYERGPVYKSKEHYHKLLGEHVAQLSSLQQLLWASNRYAVLLIFQGMDAAGKDGAIKHVMSGVNPQGCQVFSFKHPSVTELQHNFLWRTTGELPGRGRIGIFNRSYYEEVLIARVHPEILRGEVLPSAVHDEKAIWHERSRSIVHLERHLNGNGTHIIKFFLHLSKEEQRKRFLQRIDEPEKNCSDIEERKFWNEYMNAYEECLSATSTGDIPRYVVPADDKENARLLYPKLFSTYSKDSKWHIQKRAQSAGANCCLCVRGFGCVEHCTARSVVRLRRPPRNTAGQETTLFSIITNLLHFGMVIVGLDYGHAGQMTLDEITGGSPYGATTIAGGNGSRLPTANELKGARYQGRKIAEAAPEEVAAIIKTAAAQA
jgi:PPK2 family polyphosphate:nucleotide phosphotransferase